MKNLILIFLLLPLFAYNQNVGIGTSDPQEPLEVNGTIYTSQGGIKFPDQTVQTTAAFNNGGGGSNIGTAGMLIMVVDKPGFQGSFEDVSTGGQITGGIVIESESHVLSREHIVGVGGGEVNKTLASNTNITRFPDYLSTNFFLNVTDNSGINEITIYTLNGSSGPKYLQITKYLSCFLTNYSQNLNFNGENSETISFGYGKISNATYDHTGLLPVSHYCWNFVSNSICATSP